MRGRCIEVQGNCVRKWKEVIEELGIEKRIGKAIKSCRKTARLCDVPVKNVTLKNRFGNFLC